MVAPMMMPISAFDPPWLVINSGNKKKKPRLETVKKLAVAIRMNEAVYRSFLCNDVICCPK